ncbi:hypothetical protein C0991_001317, partial [Blastosporella zonata]
GGAAKQWYTGLDEATKADWALVKAAFNIRWPPISIAAKLTEEYVKELLECRLADATLGSKECVADREVWTHIAWVDKMAMFASGADVLSSKTYILQVKKALPGTIRDKLADSYTNWTTFLDDVPTAPATSSRHFANITNEAPLAVNNAYSSGRPPANVNAKGPGRVVCTNATITLQRITETLATIASTLDTPGANTTPPNHDADPTGDSNHWAPPQRPALQSQATTWATITRANVPASRVFNPGASDRHTRLQQRVICDSRIVTFEYLTADPSTPQDTTTLGLLALRTKVNNILTTADTETNAPGKTLI